MGGKNKGDRNDDLDLTDENRASNSVYLVCATHSTDSTCRTIRECRAIWVMVPKPIVYAVLTLGLSWLRWYTRMPREYL